MCLNKICILPFILQLSPYSSISKINKINSRIA